MAERPVVLVGLMGVGKTTLGPKVARRLGMRFVDLDHEIESRAGRSIADVFAVEGEAGFRTREVEALADVLDDPDVAVVATGGGVVLDATNRTRLRAVPCVWLRATPSTLARRVHDDGTRPLLAGGEDPIERLAALAEQRAAYYAQVADIVVDVDGRRRPDVVDEIVEKLEAMGAAA